MKDIIEDLVLVCALVLGIGSCCIHYAHKSDQMVERYLQEVMEARVR